MYRFPLFLAQTHRENRCLYFSGVDISRQMKLEQTAASAEQEKSSTESPEKKATKRIDQADQISEKMVKKQKEIPSMPTEKERREVFNTLPDMVVQKALEKNPTIDFDRKPQRLEDGSVQVDKDLNPVPSDEIVASYENIKDSGKTINANLVDHHRLACDVQRESKYTNDKTEPLSYSVKYTLYQEPKSPVGMKMLTEAFKRNNVRRPPTNQELNMISSLEARDMQKTVNLNMMPSSFGRIKGITKYSTRAQAAEGIASTMDMIQRWLVSKAEQRTEKAAQAAREDAEYEQNKKQDPKPDAISRMNISNGEKIALRQKRVEQNENERIQMMEDNDQEKQAARNERLSTIDRNAMQRKEADVAFQKQEEPFRKKEDAELAALPTGAQREIRVGEIQRARELRQYYFDRQPQKAKNTLASTKENNAVPLVKNPKKKEPKVQGKETAQKNSRMLRGLKNVFGKRRKAPNQQDGRIV